jgi:hypothetical protein
MGLTIWATLRPDHTTQVMVFIAVVIVAPFVTLMGGRRR